MINRRSRRRFSSLLLIFALVLIAELVYAALTGALGFRGTATVSLKEKAPLQFAGIPDDYEVTAEGGSWGTLTLEADNNGNPAQIAVITITFVDISDSLRFDFKVQNTSDNEIMIAGDSDDLAEKWTEEQDAGLTLTGDYWELAGATIAGDSTSKFYWIEIGLDDTAVNRETYTFSIRMPYGDWQ